jgi:hypothetical protein
VPGCVVEREAGRDMIALRKPKIGKARGWAAIVFGDTALELTAASSAGDEIEVARQTSAPLPTEAGLEPKARWEVAVRRLRTEVDPHEHRIVTAIGGENVFCQTLRLPTADSGELKQMLDLQIDNLTPLPVEEVVYSFEPLEVAGTETRLLLAVARKATVNERVAALEAVGLEAEAVAVDALAVFREMVRSAVLPGDERLNAFVLVSPSAVNIIIHNRGKIVAVRSLVLGTHAIAEPEIQSAIREELQRTLVAGEVEVPGAESGRVQFATWSESLRAGVAELAQSWGGPAEFLDNGSSPSPSVSVCLETARADVAHLNLLPDEWRVRRRAARVRRSLIRGAIAVGAVYLVAMLGFVTLVAWEKSRLSGVEAKIIRLQSKFEKVRTLQKTLVAMQKQLDTKYSALEVLREVGALMPDNVKLNGYTFKRDDSVTLRAQAQTATLATDFISRLEKSELFSKVTSGTSRSDPGTGLTKFDVVCTLKSAAPAQIRGGSWR